MDNGPGLGKELEIKSNKVDEGTSSFKTMIKENNENQEEETWATVVSRKKRNGTEMLKERTEQQQRLQGKAKDYSNGEKRKEESQKDEMINKLRGKMRYQREYKKETTLTMNVKNPDKLTVMMIIKAVEDKTGIGKLYGLRKKTDFEYELTLEEETDFEHILDGILINGQMCEMRKLCATERMVSFLNLPNYISDEEVLQKLTSWGVTPILPLRRRFYPGTTVADGTRFIRVKFPKDVVSLPYNTRIETEEGIKYFRVIHDHQVKTCRICSSVDHEKKDCPHFICRECMEQGHYVRDCKAPRCQSCGKALQRCRCENYEEAHEEMETDLHNEGENVEKDDEGGVLQQECVITKDIQRSEERVSKDERGCLEQGHYVRDCKAPQCQSCERASQRCIGENYEEVHEGMEMDSHNDGANVEEDDEGGVPQQVSVMTKEIQSGEERVSKDERGGEKTTERAKMTMGLQLFDGKVEQNKMENKEEGDDGVKDITSQEEVRDTKEKTFGGKESVKKNILSGGSRLKTTAQINIEKVMEKQRIRRESKEKKKKKAEMTGLREEEGRETEQK